MKLKITVHGVAYEVEVEVLDPGEGFAGPGALPAAPVQSRAAGGSSAVTAPVAPSAPPAPGVPPGSGGSVSSPIAGTVIEVKCRPGEEAREGQILLVVEAMKMNTSIAAPSPGKIKAVPVAVGDSVREGQVLVELE